MHQNLEHNDDINTSFSFTDNLEEDVITTREAELESQIAELEQLLTEAELARDEVQNQLEQVQANCKNSSMMQTEPIGFMIGKVNVYYKISPLESNHLKFD